MEVQKYLNKHTNLAPLDPRKLRKIYKPTKIPLKDQTKAGQWELMNRKPVKEEVK